MRKVLPALVLSLLLVMALAMGLITPVKAEKPLVVVIAHGALEENVQLQYMKGNITEVDWKVITEEVTYDEIKDADMIIYVQVDIDLNITDDEVAAIKRWFDQGGKTLWVTGDSDYKGGDFKRIPNTNKILKAVGSILRNDHAEAVDRESNCGASYRVAAIIAPDKGLEFLAAGVERPVLFHGPGVVAVEINGEWKPFYGKGDKPAPNVYRLAITSDKGAIAEFVKPLPAAYTIGEEGSFTLMAVEFMPNDNIVILSVEAPFDHYHGMWETVYKDVPLDGPKFVKNVVLWAVGLYGPRIPFVTVTQTVTETVTETVTQTQVQTVTETATITETSTITTTETSTVTSTVTTTQVSTTTTTVTAPDYTAAAGIGIVLLIIGIIIGYFVGKRK